MLNVTDATKTVYRSNSIPKQLVILIPNRNITFTNSDVISESVELEEFIEEERYLSFKGCYANKFKFTVADVVTDLRGEYIEAELRATGAEVIPLFKGYIDVQDNLTQEDVQTSFTCYDVLHLMGGKNMQSWVDGLTFPITVKNFRNSLFTALGITQETLTTDLINDSLSISSTFKEYVENPTALDIMQWICQLNAVFGQIGRDGLFHYRKLRQIIKGLYPSPTTYPGPNTYPSKENADIMVYPATNLGVKYEPYETDLINKVAIFDSEGIDQGQAGSGTNAYIISDNPLAFSVSMLTAASRIYDEVCVYQYVPVVNFDCVGEPYLECGDIILTQTKKNIVRTYVLHRTLTGIQALYDNIQSDADKERPTYKSTAISKILANRKSVLEIQADIVRIHTAIIQRLEADEAVVTNLSAKEANFETATANNFTATNARVGSLEADHVSVASLNAVSARVGTIEAAYITADNINAKSFTLTAGHIGNLDASKITSGTIGADRLSADTIRTKFITACSASPLQGQIDIGTIRAGSVKIWNGSSYKTLDSNASSATFVKSVNFTAKTVETGSISYISIN